MTSFGNTMSAIVLTLLFAWLQGCDSAEVRNIGVQSTPAQGSGAQESGPATTFPKPNERNTSSLTGIKKIAKSGLGEACILMCDKVTDCILIEQGLVPEDYHGTEMFRNSALQCISTCTKEMTKDEIACWANEPCEKSGKPGAFNEPCAKNSQIPEKTAQSKNEDTKKEKENQQILCSEICDRAFECHKNKKKKHRLTIPERREYCMSQCQGVGHNKKFSPALFDCYKTLECDEMPAPENIREGLCPELSNRQCVDSNECIASGWCTYNKTLDSCAHASQHDFMHSLAYTDRGLRRKYQETKLNGWRRQLRTKTLKPACRKSEGCRISGKCTATKLDMHSWNESGFCKSSGNRKKKNCSKSESCQNYGLCSSRDPVKRAKWDKRPQACHPTKKGKKKARNCAEFGRNCPDIEDCRKLCGDMPDCIFRNEYGTCLPRTTNACRAMNGGGTWEFISGKCVPQSQADCEASGECQMGRKGACSFVDGECKLGKDEDCARRYVRPRPDSYLVKTLSQKGYPEYYSKPSTPFGLEYDILFDVNFCEEFGLCKFSKRGKCVLNAEGCEKSIYCREEGLCSFDGKKCYAATDEDCANSRRCKNNGACLAHEGKCTFKCSNNPKDKTERLCDLGY